jgi:hypothetical protein
LWSRGAELLQGNSEHVILVTDDDDVRRGVDDDLGLGRSDDYLGLSDRGDDLYDLVVRTNDDLVVARRLDNDVGH